MTSKPQSLPGDFIELTKPRALVMIVYTTAMGYLIAATSSVDWIHLLFTCLGVAIAAAGSLALNQFFERNLDARMERTANRPIPSGRVKPMAALWFGMVLMLGGYIFLWFAVNPQCSIATMVCGISYLAMYTPLKPLTSYSSFVGAIPGGMLPIMGWVAARGRLEIGAWVLFVILFLWQIPHALIISIRHAQDYARAGMKQLPLVSPDITSRRHIVWNVLVLIPVTILPPFLNMTEIAYPVLALGLGFGLFIMALRYVMSGTKRAATGIFVSLTAYLPILLLAMYLDKPA